MRSISLTELRNGFSRYLRLVHSEVAPILVTSYRRPYALLQPLDIKSAQDDSWSRLSVEQLQGVWKGEDGALYDYL